MINNLTNVEIEKTVLGGFIIEKSLFSKYYSKLSLNLFTDSNNILIFQILQKLFNANKPIDLVIVCAECSRTKQNLDKYAAELTLAMSSSAHFEHYLMILVELAIKRDFIYKFQNLINITKNGEDIFNIRDKAIDFFDNLFVDKFIDNNKPTLKFSDLVESVEERFTNIGNSLPGISSSLSIFNKAFGGFQNSDLVIVAGRPGMGKTACMVQMIIDCVIQHYPVGVFSLEMSAEQIAARIITNYTKIPNSAILRKGLSNEEYERYSFYKEDLLNLFIHIDDTPSISIQNLRMKAQMLKLKYDIKILFVDYLQLATHQESKNREQEVSNISRGLKAIAKELNIPVIALAQLSRNVENRPGKRPLLSDLRDSGSIEQDADEVVFLYRPEYYGIEKWEDYDDLPTDNEAEIIIAKNRNGGLLAERCQVNMSTSTFKDL